MVDTQDVLFDEFGATAEMRQSLVLGTLDARLESMASFATDGRIWTPLGLKFAKSNTELKWVHDILTETLVRIGYIPLAFLVIGFLTATVISFKALFRIPKGPYRTMVTYFSALAIGMMSGGFSQGAMILFFPINMFWCLFLGIAYALYLWQRRDAAVLVATDQVSATNIPENTEQTSGYGNPTHAR